MTRAQPLIFDRPGPAPGQILTRGVNRASEILGQGITQLEQRQDDMRRKRDSAEQFNKNIVALTEARVAASEGPIDDMPGVIEKAHETLEKDVDKVEDPTLRAQMMRELDGQVARSMSNTLLLQNSRNVGKSIAVGEDMLDTGIESIQNGSATATEVLEVLATYVEGQKENVYGEDADKTVESMAKQLAEEQFNVLLKASPKAALAYPDGAYAKKWLKPRERRELKGIANNSIASALNNIDSRGAAIQSSAFTDREERLQALKVEAMRQPDIPRRNTTITRLDAWMSKAAKQSVTKAERVKRFGDVMAGRSKDPLPQDQSTLNGAYQLEKNTGGSITGFIGTLTEKGSDYPDDYIKDVKRDGKPETLNLARIEEQLRVMSPDRANLVAVSAGTVAETAYGATRRLTNAADIAERNAVLGRTNAIGLIENADSLLEEGDLQNAAKGRIPLLAIPTGAGLAPTPFTLPFVRVGNPRFAPSQARELQDLYRFQFVSQQNNFGAGEADALKKSAMKAASREFQESHRPIVAAVRGRNRTYFLPKSAISFNQSFSEEAAAEELTPLISSLMRSAGTRSGLLAGTPIIDRNRSTTAFAVTNTAGIVGFVQWDGNSGLAKTILPSDQDEFASLSQDLTNMRANLNPTPDLAAVPGVPKMPDHTADDIMDMAIELYRNQNNGRVPATDAEEATLITIAETIAAENGWTP